MFEMVDMQWDWPAIVNFYEAEAYCNWKSGEDGLPDGGPKYRLLTEAEHHVLRGNLGDSYDPVMAYDGISLVKAGNINANFGYGSESPVLELPANEMGKFLDGG
jgi:formylglycine-generating enzyme required for sulfatase activity